MSFRDKNIRIDDWAGNPLFIGDYEDPEVDKILDANRCTTCTETVFQHCGDCESTGYSGDFTVAWVDESDKDGCNVYEYINY